MAAVTLVGLPSHSLQHGGAGRALGIQRIKSASENLTVRFKLRWLENTGQRDPLSPYHYATTSNAVGPSFARRSVRFAGFSEVNVPICAPVGSEPQWHAHDFPSLIRMNCQIRTNRHVSRNGLRPQNRNRLFHGDVIDEFVKDVPLSWSVASVLNAASDCIH